MTNQQTEVTWEDKEGDRFLVRRTRTITGDALLHINRNDENPLQLFNEDAPKLINAVMQVAGIGQQAPAQPQPRFQVLSTSDGAGLTRKSVTVWDSQTHQVWELAEDGKEGRVVGVALPQENGRYPVTTTDAGAVVTAEARSTCPACGGRKVVRGPNDVTSHTCERCNGEGTIVGAGPLVYEDSVKVQEPAQRSDLSHDELRQDLADLRRSLHLTQGDIQTMLASSVGNRQQLWDAIKRLEQEDRNIRSDFIGARIPTVTPPPEGGQLGRFVHINTIGSSDPDRDTTLKHPEPQWPEHAMKVPTTEPNLMKLIREAGTRATRRLGRTVGDG